jgi:hypothetical protein
VLPQGNSSASDEIMTLPMVLLPLFVEVILTFGLLFWMAWLRGRDFKTGIVKADEIALRESAWPKQTMQVMNSYANQFELPVLFYVLTILAYVTHHAGIVFVVLAWLFVIFRLLHAYVHVTSNTVTVRGPFFGGSSFVLAIMWIIFIIQVLSGT